MPKLVNKAEQLTLENVKNYIVNKMEYVGKILQERFAKNEGVIYLSKDGCHTIKNGKKFRIIISASMYWVKKCSLPVKKCSEAKKLAPSFFDSFLPDGEFTYEAFFLSDNTYALIAFDSEEICKIIKSSEINFNHISAVYFAQSEFTKLEEPLILVKNRAIIVNEDVVLDIPQAYLSQKAVGFDIFFPHFYYSNRSFSIELFQDNTPDKKTYYFMFGLMVLILASLATQYAYLADLYNKISTSKEEYLESRKLPNSTIALNSIKVALQKKESTQYSIRNKLRYLQDLNFTAPDEPQSNKGTATAKGEVILVPGSVPGDKNRLLVGPIEANLDGKEHIKTLLVKDNQLEIVISLSSDKRAEYIKDFLKKQFKVDSITVKNKILTAKVTI